MSVCNVWYQYVSVCEGGKEVGMGASMCGKPGAQQYSAASGRSATNDLL